MKVLLSFSPLIVASTDSLDGWRTTKHDEQGNASQTIGSLQRQKSQWKKNRKEAVILNVFRKVDIFVAKQTNWFDVTDLCQTPGNNKGVSKKRSAVLAIKLAKSCEIPAYLFSRRLVETPPPLALQLSPLDWICKELHES